MPDGDFPTLYLPHGLLDPWLRTPAACSETASLRSVKHRLFFSGRFTRELPSAGVFIMKQPPESYEAWIRPHLDAIIGSSRASWARRWIRLRPLVGVAGAVVHGRVANVHVALEHAEFPAG